MTTNLNSGGYISLTSPYTEVPRTATSIPSSVIDWILVQLRSTPSEVVVSRSFFLKSDGNIVDTEGTTAELTMQDVAEGDYYIVVRHRNHLAVMSATAQSLNSSSATLHDFTTGIDKYYGSDAKQLASGVYGMYTGDANGNGQVQNDDKNDYWKLQVGTAGYKGADFNLNGQVQNDDKNDYWKNNVGRGTQVP